MVDFKTGSSAIAGRITRRSPDDGFSALSNHVGPFADLALNETFKANKCDIFPTLWESDSTSLRELPSHGQSRALGTIQRPKNVSLHQATLSASGAARNPICPHVIQVFNDFRGADEKAIIFVTNKTVQARLAVWLHERHGFTPKIVNGETNAAASSSSKTRGTRKSIINDFRSKQGFNLIIMSPLAVGAGLTVVGANHAIHLERHWNPAKEAQATDRIYRIGQTRPVHVYLPLANHPTLQSFDVNLDALLRSKTDLNDSVVVPGKVEDEMMHRMGSLDAK